MCTTINDEILQDVLYSNRVRCEQEVRDNVVVTSAGCWEWTRARMQFGYGVWSKRSWLPLAIKAKPTIVVHRVVAWLWLGLPSELIAKGPRGSPKLQVLHRCDNPPCCNPEHLYLGSAADNVRDMMQRGRYVNRRFTASQVVEIRRLALANHTYAEIGQLLGVSLAVAHDAAVGKTYGGVDFPTAPARQRGRRKKAA